MEIIRQQWKTAMAGWYHAAPAGLAPGTEILPRSRMTPSLLFRFKKRFDGPLSDLYGEGQEWRADRVWMCKTVDDAAWWGKEGDVVYEVEPTDPKALTEMIGGWDNAGQFHAASARVVRPVATIGSEGEVKS